MEMVAGIKETVNLTECASILYGYPFNSKRFNTAGIGMPLIRIRDINTGLSDTFTDEKAPERYVVQRGDCIIGMDGNFEIVKWKHADALLNQRVCKVTPISVKKEFLMHFLRDQLKRIEAVAQSTTVKHLSAKDMNGIRVPVVSLDRQKWFETFSLQLDKSKFAVLKSSNLNL